jgi:NADPH:quinone reductase-like Zn-dependent oxidoreductase
MVGETMRAVRFDRYGDVNELQVVDVARPVAEAGRAVVDVVAAAINPGEAAIRTGLLDAMFPATFPEGEGSDLAGVVAEVGAGVTNVAVGDEVIGWSDERSSHAEAVSVPATQLVRKPTGVPWEAGGSLYVAGVTAVGNLQSVQPKRGDRVAVSAAAGGVGSITVQLARRLGAEVIGIAGPDRAAWLESVGVVPVAYGDGLGERLGAVAPDGLDAFIDCFGGGYVDLAVELGIPRDRINTIIDREAARRLGTRQDGMSTVTDPAAAISELAALVAGGELVIPVAQTFSLEDVRDAYRQLEERHTLGKIVLLMRPPPG